ncbi:MAG: site-specific recombinase XerD [Marinobacter sp. T13-3]|nr:MAG: site-specific recombinase XerD [Marinobacter sp. T13-3]
MDNRLTNQLFHPVRSLTLFSHYSLGKISSKDGANMPHLVWPNRSPCMLANLYMLALRDRPGRGGRQGLSRRGSKGGTMGDYAAKISQLIRFCYQNNWDFIDLTDDKFTIFINSLRSERDPNNAEIRKKTEITITAVGRICLDFLSFVGHFHGDPNFVSNGGTIRAIQKPYAVKTGRGRRHIFSSYWHHHSFSDGDRLKKRNPIPAENVGKLREAINSGRSSRFIQSRQHCLLSILEQVGARRGELVELRVSDILTASNMSHPMLRIINLKQGDNQYRLVPVTHMLLSELKKHIRVYRNKIIKEKLGKANDHDLFFISETSGKPLVDSTIGSEISGLRCIARIEEKACAHMFRHAFITNLFVLLIERHEFENTDDFRKALLSSEKFKMEVMQWTGHRNMNSLDHYIDFAFAKVAGYAKTVTAVHLLRATEVFDKMLFGLTEQLKSGMSIEQYNVEVQKLVELRNKDFEVAKSRET